MATSMFNSVVSIIEPYYSTVYCSFEQSVDFANHLLVKEKEKFLSFNYELNFNDVQKNFLYFLVIFICINLLSILLIWRYFGTRIVKRFKKPAPPRVLEELSRSVAQLKLPKSHSPRM